MRVFDLVLRFQAADEVEVGKLMLEKFGPLLVEIRAHENEAYAYVREVTPRRTVTPRFVPLQSLVHGSDDLPPTA